MLKPPDILESEGDQQVNEQNITYRMLFKEGEENAYFNRHGIVGL